MINTLCFIDLDGVLADFVEAAFIRHDIRIPWEDIQWDFITQSGVDPETFWRSLDFDFWRNVFRTLECSAIIDAAEKKFGVDNIFLCSSPCKTFGCTAGKAMWVDLYLPQHSRRLILTNRKEIFSGPGRVLIDDLDENINKWVAAGGTGILVPRPWNTTRHAGRDVSEIIVKKIESIDLYYRRTPTHIRYSGTGNPIVCNGR